MTYQYPFKSNYQFGTLYGTKGSSWSCGWHSGLDIYSTSKGGNGIIYPISKGTVLKVTTTGSYGNCVYVIHDDNYVSLYAHMLKVLVKVGDTVSLNTQLGVEGTSGNSSGVHLHLEIHYKTYSYPASINPKIFIEDKIKEQEKDEVTQEQFETMYKTMIAKSHGDNPSSWAKEVCEAAKAAGVFKGDGSGNYDWQEPVTREALASVLKNLGAF